MNNKNENVNFDESDREVEEFFKEFSLAVDKELNEVSKFTTRDVNLLLGMILENLKDLSDLELSIDTINYKISTSQDIRARLKYQLNMTKKDILEENLINIYLVYNAAALGIWLTSPNPIEFLKRFLIVGIIGIVSYDANARYFASNYRKQKSELIISEIEKNVDISRSDIRNINRFRDMYIETLKYELNKLSEININDQENIKKNNDKMLRLIHELDLDYLLNDIKTKKRIK